LYILLIFTLLTILSNGLFAANSSEWLSIDDLLDTKIEFNYFFLNLKLGNILDTEIRYPTTLSNAWAEKGNLGLGRNMLLTMGYEF
jgi:hypothetical protein